MADKLHQYRGAALNVTYDATRCIHAAACIRSLPRAFDPGSRPWVMPDNGSPEAVRRAVESCPTGALQYHRLDGGPDEVAATENAAVVTRNGPTYLRGDLTLRDPEQALERRETRMALCRCGATGNRPFCDGSHARSRFRDPGAVAAPTEGGNLAPSGPLEVAPEPGGPVLLRGRIRIHDAAGTAICVVDEAALCRCGRSGTKPFCDGSHGRLA